MVEACTCSTGFFFVYVDVGKISTKNSIVFNLKKQSERKVFLKMVTKANFTLSRLRSPAVAEVCKTAPSYVLSANKFKVQRFWFV